MFQLYYSDLLDSSSINSLIQKIKPDEMSNFVGCFLTGTAAEVTPVQSIGNFIFKPGEYCLKLSQAYSDLVNGSVYVVGKEAPKVVTKDMLKSMNPGTVMVDVSIDQGGCFETSRATTHADPIYEIDGIMHYCVANMPGAVARTSTLALGNATLPFIMSLANKGWVKACSDDPHLFNGLNVHDGKLTYAAVGEALGLETVKPDLKALSVLH